jgi:hypothetical protein
MIEVWLKIGQNHGGIVLLRSGNMHDRYDDRLIDLLLGANRGNVAWQTKGLGG